jgi:L-lactate dehydrogenase complex protein LldE
VLFRYAEYVPRKVSLFVTCLVDQLFPNVGLAMADVLERAGFDVDFPEAQTCCGQPAFNSGFRDEARAVAQYWLDVFKTSDYVVIPSGSCTSMITHHFADLLDVGEHRLEDRVWEFSRFLLEVAKTDDFGARFPAVATYHDSCHALRELHIKRGPRQLLGHVRDLELREAETAEECCGFGGTFSVKFDRVSAGMAQTKLDSIVKTGADTIISIDSSCLMQLQGVIDRTGAPLRTVHLAEVLAAR